MTRSRERRLRDLRLRLEQAWSAVALAECEERAAAEQLALAERATRQARGVAKNLADSVAAMERHCEAGKIIASDHAILRYLERVCGVDVESIRLELSGDTRADDWAVVAHLCDTGDIDLELTERAIVDPIEAVARVLGSGTYPANGFKAVVDRDVVVTVVATR